MTAESIFSTWKLGMERRETQDWFYPLPGNGKAKREAPLSGRGVERDCESVQREREREGLKPMDKEYV